MTRHTAFRFSLDPTVEQNAVLLRHVGAARFAFNQSLELHLAARDGRLKTSDSREVPWSGFSLINAFNTWKTSEAAGRRFVVGTDWRAMVEVTGLAWRDQILAQVFEEAAVDLARALRAWTDSRKGLRGGRPVGHPSFKKKNAASGAFRIRSQRSRTGRSSIRLGEKGPRSVTLPKIGSIRVHDDTRRLRRMIAKGHARILSATITRGAGGRWWISISVEAADLHPQMRHPSLAHDNKTPWVGVDRGLKSAVVAANADGAEVMRVDDAPRHARRRRTTCPGLKSAQSASAVAGGVAQEAWLAQPDQSPHPAGPRA